MSTAKNQKLNQPLQPKPLQQQYTVVDQRLVQQCKLHVRANRVARDCKNPKYCECCKKSYENERISVFCSLKELAFLGPGIPLYFQFINTTRNILMISCIFSIYMMYQNQMEGTYCKKESTTENKTDCYRDLYSSFSLVNIKSTPSLIEKYAQIQFLLTLALFIAQQIFFRTMCVLKDEVESSNRTPEDYTVQIFNMPQGFIDRRAYPLQNQNQNQKIVLQQYNSNQYQMDIGMSKNTESDLDYNNIHKNGYNQNEIMNAIGKQYNNKLTIAEVNIAYDLEEFHKGDDKMKGYILHGQNRRQYCSRSCFVTFTNINMLNVFLADQQRNSLQRFWARLRILFGGHNKTYLLFRNNFLHVNILTRYLFSED